jgi:hypothetical protein
MSLSLARPVRVAALLLALTACGAEAAGSDGADGSGSSGGSDLGAPAGCAEAFPVAVGTPDLADVTNRPADFPDPPVDAVLCQTSSTLDDTVTIASYATEAGPDEVLSAYEELLGATYEVVRADDGAGETLTGDLGGVFVQVSPRDGAFSVAFGEG